jgi:NADPH:quinone reductase-like Zn-dependent oxidoreductase
MRAAGIRRYSDPVELLDLPDPGELRSDEVLVEVRCCGIGNWDDIARTGGWDLGRQPPMALGVEAAGVIAGTGAAVHGRTSGSRPAGSRPADGRLAGGPARDGLAVGDRVMTHSLPLRGQGAWAEWFVAAAADVAVIPDTVPFDAAAALPVPGLTADQALGDGLGARPGATVLVHGASGVTGMLMVELAAGRGAEVIATAGTDAAARVTAAGAAHVLDRRAPDWPGQARRLTAGRGVDLAVNAAPAGAPDAITAVRDGGRLVTITSDPPAADRGIEVREVYVAPDGTRLARLGELLAAGTIRVTVGAAYRLGDAERALGRVRRGSGGQAVVLQVP